MSASLVGSEMCIRDSLCATMQRPARQESVGRQRPRFYVSQQRGHRQVHPLRAQRQRQAQSK
eukprot:9652876-Alexandrium_andersonii.AAC.1